MYCTKRITDDMVWVGADDRRLALFEGVYGVPDGVSYNSYLILDEKTILFDTVDKAVAHNFFDNVAHELAGRKLDYLVISHMEPDHAATIEDIALRYPEAKIVCNAKIRDMLARFFPTDLSERLHLVKEGDSLSTGRHEFTFVMAPMVHWPEVMMTYDKTDKILFSADAFGSFGALNGRIFADECDFMNEYLDEARRYYTNIVGKYGPQVQTALRKAAGLDIKYVCPLHSFVWRQGFGDFLAKYDQWSSYTPEVKGVLIAYASVYGHTENAANILAAKLSDRGVKVKMYDTSVTPSSYILSDAFKYSHLVLAATTYNAGVFVTMDQLLHELVTHNLQNRKVAVIENGSWAPTSGGLMRELLSQLKGTEFIGDTLTVKSALTEGQLAELDVLADAIAADVLPPKPAPVEVKVSAESGMDGVYEVENAAFNKFSYGCEILTTPRGRQGLRLRHQHRRPDHQLRPEEDHDKLHQGQLHLRHGRQGGHLQHQHPHRGRALRHLQALRLPVGPRRGQVRRLAGRPAHGERCALHRPAHQRGALRPRHRLARLRHADALHRRGRRGPRALGQAELHLQLLPRPHQAQEGPRASGRRGLDLQGLRLLPRGRGAARGLRLPAVQARPRGLRALRPRRRQQEEGLAVHRLRLLLRGRDSPARLRLPHLPPRRGRLRARRAVSTAA